MGLYELLLLLHILLFVYWLGGDIGVFYASGFVVDASLSRESRLVAAKIMLGCDLVPKICMSLMLTVGGLLSATIGVQHSPWLIVCIVLIGPFWLTVVLVLHYRHAAPYIPLLTKLDFYFRCLIIVALLISSAYTYATGRLEETPWLLVKLLAFAFLVFCGLMIRIKLKGFSQSYGKLLNNEHTAADDTRMLASLNAVRPWVVTIWLVLVVQAYLGIVKPSLL